MFNGELEQFQSLALEICAKDIDIACETLSISADPFNWSVSDVRSWIIWQMEQYNLPPIVMEYFNVNGIELCSLSEEDFKYRAPQCGEILFAQLDIWKTAANFAFNHSRREENYIELNSLLNNQWAHSPVDQQVPHIKCEPVDRTIIKMECMSPSMSTTSSCSSPDSIGLPGFGCDRSFMENHGVTSDYGSERAQSDDEISEDGCGVASPGSVVSSSSPTCPSSSGSTRSSSGSHIHLWQFLKELLGQPQLYGSSIRWLDRTKGIFKIEDSVKVARLWGKRKNRPAMNYDKLSRSIRQYYKKGIMKKTERSQRLVYQFCHPYAL